jgi:hypothetical protein
VVQCNRAYIRPVITIEVLKIMNYIDYGRVLKGREYRVRTSVNPMIVTA